MILVKTQRSRSLSANKKWEKNASEKVGNSIVGVPLPFFFEDRDPMSFMTLPLDGYNLSLRAVISMGTGHSEHPPNLNFYPFFSNLLITRRRLFLVRDRCVH